MISDYDFWMLIRAALLMFVDAIEQKLDIKRTKEMREKQRVDLRNID